MRTLRLTAVCTVLAASVAACSSGSSTGSSPATSGGSSAGGATTSAASPSSGAAASSGPASSSAASSAAATSAAAAGGCDGKLPSGTTKISVWYHQGEAPDADSMKKIAAAFNASQSAVHVDLKEIPGDYSAAVKGAAASKQLPDVMDADSSNAANYAWSNYLQPLDSCIPSALKADLLPSIIAGGTYNSKQYALGIVDSGLALYASKKALVKAGVRIPTGYTDAWTATEFDQALAKLKAAGYKKPLDLQKNLPDGYYQYAYEPFLWSAGGDLVDRKTYRSADGILNGPAAVKGMTAFQSWFKQGYVDDNTDNNAFLGGRSAMSWVGFWQYLPFHKAMGDDLLVLPMPNMGVKPSNGQGSWQWTMTRSGKDPDAMWAWIAWTLKPGNVTTTSDSVTGVPALKSVLATNQYYSPTGPLHLIAQALTDGYSNTRPMHPGYPAMASAFSTAVRDIIAGKDVKSALDTAAKAVDDDLSSNSYYPPPK